MELTINNVAALYFHDRFALGVGLAGVIAGLFGLMNIFARTLGGFFGDRAGIRFGLRGRVLFLGGVLLMEGLALMFFSRMDALLLAIPAMLVFSVFVQMSEGATFSVVPFINRKALGTVAGIVGAGGNAGAVAAGFLFRVESVAVQDGFLYMGVAVVAASSLVLVVGSHRGSRCSNGGGSARFSRARLPVRESCGSATGTRPRREAPAARRNPRATSASPWSWRLSRSGLGALPKR